jgi:hypothetical protein
MDSVFLGSLYKKIPEAILKTALAGFSRVLKNSARII